MTVLFPVGARLAGDGDFEAAIAGKPGSYRNAKGRLAVMPSGLQKC
jgi:hypothetical protein